MQQTVSTLTPGTVVAGRFEVRHLAGAGGAGVVYRCADRHSGVEVALKVLRSSLPDSANRFLREAEALARIVHPAVVRHVAHDVDDDGGAWLAMEWLAGETLEDRLELGPLGVEETLELGSRIASALGAAHDAGLLHRDVKPSNVVLVDGRLDQAALVDFGLARAAVGQATLTRTGTVIGTPAYMAPEQARGAGRGLDARADVFSLGCVLWECLTGRRAFAGEHPLEVLAAVMSVDPPAASSLAPAVPGHVDRLLERMLSKDANDRPADGNGARVDIDLLRATGTEPESAARARRCFELPAPAPLVWALLSDTNRWDRIAGAPASVYRRPAPHAPQLGHAEIAGVPSAWRELGEWVEGRWLWGERRFSEGAFASIDYRFECREHDGHTTVDVSAWATPAPDTPPAAAAMMAGHLGQRLDKYVAALTDLLTSAPLPALSPGESPVLAARRLLLHADRRLLAGHRRETDADVLRSRAEHWGHHGPARDSLLGLLERGSDDQIRQMRPRALARAWSADERDALGAYLSATDAGLVDLRLQLDCPRCRVAAQVVSSVAELGGLGHCEECRVDFDLDLERNVEVVFHVNPAVREVREEVWCAGSPVFRPHVFALLRLGPRETRDVTLPFPPGAMRARLRDGAASAPVEPAPGTSLLVGADLSCEVVADGSGLRLVNQTDRLLEVQLERAEDAEEAVTFADALAVPGFRERLGSGTGGEIGRATLSVVALRVEGLAALCESIGDGEALARVRETGRIVRETTAARGGAVVHEGHGEWLLCFRSEAEASAAARAIPPAAPVPLSHAVQTGPCLVVQGRSGVELFGSTVQRCLSSL